MPIITLTREQCRELDRRATEEFGINSLVLMENAGRGCVDVLERLGINGPVVILCGKGNNAGDGFVIARHLEIRGYKCRVLLLDGSAELRGDAATNFSILPQAGVQIVGPTTQFREYGRDADWLVDAMLGTGARGEPRPPYDAAIDWFNSQPCKKLAVDVPSGLDCNTGQPAGHTVRADHTCTFAALKTGFNASTANQYTGTVHVCDIGTPPRLLQLVLQNQGVAGVEVAAATEPPVKLGGRCAPPQPPATPESL
jgi:NAD(P)H-hydrate epimerase